MITTTMLGTQGPWVHHAAPQDVDKVVAEGAASHLRVVLLQGARMRVLDDLFREYAREFRFPDYFGYNWPAFYECMTELDGCPAPAFLTIISDPDELLSREPEEMPTLTRQLESIGRRWASAFGLIGPEWGAKAGEIPFHTVLLEPSRHEAAS
jgi:hypothetical protein